MLLTRPTLLTREQVEGGTDWPRIRFAATLALYGASLGAAAIIINLLSQTPRYVEPEHLPFALSFLFGSYGAASGALITGPTAYWIHGGIGFFYVRFREPRGLLAWSILGFAYGLMFVVVMGAFFLPFGGLLVDFYDGHINMPGLRDSTVNILSGMWVPLAVILGFPLFFTGLLAGGLFAAGGWVIDRFNSSEDAATATYGPWIISLVLSMSVIGISIFGPVDFLAKLG